MGVLEIIKECLAIIAILLATSSAFTIMNGDLEGGLTPGWVDFATSYPMVFAFILVIGATIFGAPFVAAVDNV